MTDPAHLQRDHAVRFEWGPTGAAALAADAGTVTAVVVDVLSFTTTVAVAVERGTAVHPFRWKDDRARAYAARVGATLAVGRLEGAQLAANGGVSLSPAAMSRVEGVAEVVLPSPNGSTVTTVLADTGATVVAASLRNATAVAGWTAARPQGGPVVVVAGGERWPDGSLRPAVEDLWGAGAVIAALADSGVTGLSPEARVAEAAFRAVRADLPARLATCASGLELVAKGFAEDVRVAAELDASRVVPVLSGGAFRAAG